MLAFTWVALRFIHFTALMLVFGCALYGAWLAPVSVRRLMMRRFLRLQRHAATWSFISATLMLAIQGGLMGSGWRDVVSTDVWLAVLQTQFGGVWLWQIILALVTLVVTIMVPRSMPRLLLMLTIAQFILLAGVGHATLHCGIPGAIQQVNHALHLVCAAAWFGGLLPVLYCMRMAQGRWREQAISTMMRFSRYGHLFVIPWHMAYGRLLLLKGALVMLMVAIALVNRYVLVPRMRQDNRGMTLYFIWMTELEWGIGAVVLAIVSLFATLEPF